ncbi:SDR family oxidoreductase [Fluviicola sp.]|jgi:short-subunit dehydrogenase|uniref:SDR family NAD(P)-dependent oxidoreductase n=1 Tax=Fluviicola sp. TaxID=1917219 RepID=UPI00281E799A|nr:SDR family oxidoreductase [Fluviicola sp.]MDR0802925.1 SDR family oxidoreductase [Fluviicola sp.]
MRVSGKTFIVTGGGAGMGRELVLQLLQKGGRVAAVDINSKALEELKSIAGSGVTELSLHVLDINDREAVAKLPEEVVAVHGTLDGLFNNAGIIQPFVRINDLDFKDIERVMHINFYGLLYLTKACLPYLLQRPEAHIVNTSSMGGFLPVPGQGIYGASKAAVKLLTEALYAELLPTKIRVTVVFPGAVGTEITKNSGVEIKMNAGKEQKVSKTLSPVKAASVIISGMEKNKFRVLVGNDAKFMDFLYRLNPKFATKFIQKQMKDLL